MKQVKFVRHRINKVADLTALERTDIGIEIDLRSDVNQTGELHLGHDPWVRGDSFSDWLDVYVARGFEGPLILNTKEDGLETRVLDMVKAAKVSNFFFLDTALPTLRKMTHVLRVPNFAVRVSSIEPIECALPFTGLAEWAWLDCFDGIPLGTETAAKLARNFKVCLVSPELQGKPVELISKFQDLVPYCSAICTKSPERW